MAVTRGRAGAILLSLALGMVGCGGGSSGGGGGSGIAITTSGLSDGAVGTTYAATVTTNASAGTTLNWNLIGSLPPGLSIVYTNFEAFISGNPAAAGTFNFTLEVSDGGGNDSQALAITILPGPPSIVTTSLNDGVINLAYSAQITATGGSSAGYTWSVTSGSLPPGLSLTDGTPSATLSGTPTQTGTFNFTLNLIDSVGLTASQALSVTINNPAPLNITTVQLPGGVVGASYNELITAQDGTVAGYTWSVTSGSLPAGLSLSNGTPSATLSGQPTTSQTYNFDLTVTDSGGNMDTQSYTVTINPALVITTTTLPGALEGYPFSETISATGGTGLNYDFTLTGTPPPGLNLTDGTPDALFDGTPTTAGTYNFTIELIDSENNMTSQAYTMDIVLGDPIRLRTFILPHGQQNQPLTLEIEAAGGIVGTDPSFALSSGSLPPGMSITQPSTGSKVGSIGGTPTTPGHYRYAIEVTDGFSTVEHEYVTTIAVPTRWIVYRADLTTSAFEELYAVDISTGTPGTPIALDPMHEVTDDFEYKFSWDGNWLFYIGNAPGRVYGIDMSGPTPGTPVELTSAGHVGDVNAIQISPDDRWLVYAGDQDVLNQDELYAVDISGGAPFPAPIKISTATPPTNSDVLDDDIDPTSYIPGLVYGSPSPSTFDGYAFSPDGNWLAYRHDGMVDNFIEVWVLDMSGTTPGLPQRAIDRNPPHTTVAEEFCWSNDSQWLAITGDYEIDGDLEIYVVNMDSIGVETNVTGPQGGGGSLEVISGVGYYNYFTFAPDATSLVYRADPDVSLQYELFFCSLAGGTPMPGVKVSGGAIGTNEDVLGWVYSPDSRYLAYVSDEQTTDKNELYLVSVDEGVLGTPTIISHTPGIAAADVISFSTTDRNVVWASSDHIVFRSDGVTDAVNEAFVVDVSGGAPFPQPVALAPTPVTNGDVGTVWPLPDGDRVGLIGDILVDNSQDLFIAFISSPGTIHRVSNQTGAQTSITLEVADTADNDGGCFHSPNERLMGIFGDQLTSVVDELWINDISGAPPYPMPAQKVSPTNTNSALDVWSYLFQP